jgi:hypothetical protein
MRAKVGERTFDALVQALSDFVEPHGGVRSGIAAHGSTDSGAL